MNPKRRHIKFNLKPSLLLHSFRLQPSIRRQTAHLDCWFKKKTNKNNTKF